MTVVRDSWAALSFVGTNKVSVTRTATHETASLSVSAWAKLNALSGNQTMVRKFSTSGFMLRFVSGAPSLQVVNTGTRTLTSSTIVQRGVWYHIVGTYDSATATLKVYINGVLDSSTTVGSGAIIYDTDALVFGNEGGQSEPLVGILDEPTLYALALTQAQVLSLYNTGGDPVTPTGKWLFNEGAGTTVADTSGNGNTGTITAATFTADVPFKPRVLVNQNLVTNGNFEYAPPFVAITTAAQLIDGTAAGSTSNPLFGWAMQIPAGSAASRFDPTLPNSGVYCMKVSTTAVSSFGLVTNRYAGLLPGAPINQGVSYTYSYWMKTNFVSGDSADGAFIAFKERNAAGSNIATTNSTKIKTTTGWTNYTGTFTTNVATSFLDCQLSVTGNTGTATLIMDAFFDDLTITPTTPTARTAA